MQRYLPTVSRYHPPIPAANPVGPDEPLTFAPAEAMNLPTAEVAAVYLGAYGLDWLADGHADPLLAALLAAASGAVLILLRWRNDRPKEHGP